MADRVTVPAGQVEWWDEHQRTSTWAKRYGGKFDEVRQLVSDSKAEAKAERARRLARRRTFLSVVGTLAALCFVLGVVGIVQLLAAQTARSAAQKAFERAYLAAREAETAKTEGLKAQSRAMRAYRDAIRERRRAEQESARAAAATRKSEVFSAALVAKNADLVSAVGREKLATSGEKVKTAEATRNRGTLFLEAGTGALQRGDVLESEVLLAAAYRDDPGNPAVRILLPQATEKVETRGPTASLPPNQTVLALAYSPDPRHAWFATGDTGGVTTLWRFGGRLLARFTDQRDAITALAFDSTGTRLATGARDGSLVVRNLVSGGRLALEGHHERINSVTFSPDRARLATSSADGTVKVWSASTGAVIHTFRLSLKESVKDDFDAAIGYDAQFTPDGKRLLACEEPGEIQMWALATFTPQDILSGAGASANRGSCRHLAISPDGTMAVADLTAIPGGLVTFNLGSSDKQLASVLRSVASPYGGEKSTKLEGTINSLAFDPAGTRILASSDDGTAELLDRHLKSLQTFGRRGSNVPDRVNDAVFSPNGVSVVTAHADGTIRMYDLEKSDVVSLHAQAETTRLAFAPGSDRFVSAGSAAGSGNVVFWHLPRRHGALFERPHHGAVSDIAAARNGATFVSGARDGTVVVWDYGSPVTRSRTLPFASDGSWVDALHFNPAETAVVAAGGRHLQAWDIRSSPRLLVDLQTRDPETVFSDAAFLPAGDVAVTQRRVYNHTWVPTSEQGWAVWSPATRRLVMNPDRGWITDATQLAVVDGGRAVIVASKVTGFVRFIRRSTMTSYGDWNGISEVAVSPSSTTAALGGGWGGLSLVNTSTGRLLQYWRDHPSALGSAGHGRVTALAFTEDGRWLASAGADDGDVRLWDVRGLVRSHAVPKPQLVLSRGTRAQISHLEFSPGDGRFMLTVSSDGDAQLWNRDTGQLLETFRISATRVTTAAFVARGNAVALGAADGRLAVFPLLASPASIASMVDRVVADAQKSELHLPPLVQTALSDLKGKR